MTSAFDHTEPPADPALRVKAIDSLLIDGRLLPQKKLGPLFLLARTAAPLAQ